MAKLPALIAVIAKYEPRGEATVENHARKLRAGGIMTTGKRGVGAPEMMSSDATNLLFSMVARRADEVAETVTALRSAVLEGELPGEMDPTMIYTGFSFADRINDERGLTLAGKFMDGLVDDLVTNPACLMVDDTRYFIDRIEIHDPQTGFGKVIFVFRYWFEETSENGKTSSFEKTFSLRFNVISKVITDPHDLPEIKIQNSIVLSELIIRDVIRAARMSAAA